MCAVRAGTLCHRIHEFLVSPRSYAGLKIRGDVGCEDGSERRLDRTPAGEETVAARNGMTGGAIAGYCEIVAALDLAEVLRVGDRGGNAPEKAGQQGAKRCLHDRVCPHQVGTSGPGFLRYCERIAAADQ
jgi:hypothetical protein